MGSGNKDSNDESRQQASQTVFMYADVRLGLLWCAVFEFILYRVVSFVASWVMV
jgi:hypothetical protein